MSEMTRGGQILVACAAAVAMGITLLVGLARLAEGSAPPSHPVPPSFQIGVLADTDYNAPPGAGPEAFPALMQELNNEQKLEFVVHLGDIWGAKSCTDEQHSDAPYDYVREIFDQSVHPLVYTPGDNEWVDCAGDANLGPRQYQRDPLDALAALRRAFHLSHGNQSLGVASARLTLERQSDDPSTPVDESQYVENQRWSVTQGSYGTVVFATLHVTGSADDCTRRDLQPDGSVVLVGSVTTSCSSEALDRRAANIAWLKSTFAAATQMNAKGVMVFMQADPRYEAAATAPLRLPYNDYLRTLYRETLLFGKPVTLVHGDTHYFRLDQPFAVPYPAQDPFADSFQVPANSVPGQLRRVPNFTRIETAGWPETGWTRITVDLNDPNVFVAEPGR
ncbi:MAG TPA: hypothetical protein VGJ95_02280 [Pseudonocardiaceae bacterium]|jgi:predicted phosphodiesterase